MVTRKNREIMRKLRFWTGAWTVAMGLLAGCSGEDDDPAKRVLVFYGVGDNSLSGYVQNSLDGLAEGMATAPEGTRTVAFVDEANELPRLVEITREGERELYRWPEERNSASVEMAREVMERVLEEAPAERYGLVLWSHGLAWVPSTAEGYAVKSAGRSTREEPVTKWFGQDDTPGPTGYLETEELAEAIPAGMFDYILFDACFMGSVEVLYALREKTESIVSSPAEVLAESFPYGEITGALLASEPDLEGVCEAFYRYYANHNQQNHRAATVSLVNTAELEGLAAATRAVFAEAAERDPAALEGFAAGEFQRLDRYKRHFLFDMGSIVHRLEAEGLVDAATVDTWDEQLARAVVYEAHTPRIIDFALEACCGLSMYFPIAAYEELNTYYRTLGWYGVCYPGVTMSARSCIFTGENE